MYFSYSDRRKALYTGLRLVGFQNVMQDGERFIVELDKFIVGIITDRDSNRVLLTFGSIERYSGVNKSRMQMRLREKWGSVPEFKAPNNYKFTDSGVLVINFYVEGVNVPYCDDIEELANLYARICNAVMDSAYCLIGEKW